ncbi:MAG TPA: hypothetical protein VEK07_06665 [Polyangiaceae bacterium]|nr:hypothetical protein [Polyangiaceae bacterium]
MAKTAGEARRWAAGSSLYRLVDIRSGEARVAIFGFAGLLLLIIAGHTALETARDALLLTGPGPRALGLVYIAIAACTFPASALSAAAGRHLGPRRALMGALLTSAALATSLATLAPSPVSAISLYVASGVIASVLVPQFWTLVGMILTTAQGRRLFGIIAAAGVVGGVLGSGAASAALFFLPVRALPVLSGAVFLVAAGALYRFKSIEQLQARRPQPRAAFTASIRALTEAPFVIHVAAIVFVSTATLLTFDYLFKSTVARMMPSQNVAPFVARFYFVLNVLSLGVQLFAGSALVQRLGTTAAIVLTPLLLFVGAAASFLAGGAAPVVLAAKAIDGALRYSIHRITGELIYLPVAARVRQRAKPLIDGALARTAQTVTGAVLLALGGTAALSPRPLAGLVTLLAGGWLIGAATIRRPYLTLLHRVISHGELDAQESPEPLDLESAEFLVQRVASRDPMEVTSAMTVLERRRRGGLISALILLHRDPAVLKRALDIFSASSRVDWFPLAKRLLEDPREEVRLAAARALAAKSELDPRLIERDPSLRVRGYAAVQLALQGPHEDVRADPHVTAVLVRDGASGTEARIGLLAAIADAAPSPRLSLLLLMLGELPSKVTEATELLARAAARQHDARLIRPLIGLLSAREGRESVRAALVQFGDPALAAVCDVLRDGTQPRNLRIHMPKTLARFGNKAAAERLLESIETDGDGLVRYKSICALGALIGEHRVIVDRVRVERLAEANLLEYFKVLGRRVALEAATGEAARPTVAGRLLVGLLDDKGRQSLDRCFRLLKIAHPREDIHRVQVACLSSDAYTKANGAEFLDTKLRRRDEQGLRQLLQIVVDDLSAKEQVARSSPVVRASVPETADEALADLIRDPDVMVATLAGVRALEVGSEALRAAVASIRRQRPEVDGESTGPLRALWAGRSTAHA